VIEVDTKLAGRGLGHEVLPGTLRTVEQDAVSDYTVRSLAKVISGDCSDLVLDSRCSSHIGEPNTGNIRPVREGSTQSVHRTLVIRIPAPVGQQRTARHFLRGLGEP